MTTEIISPEIMSLVKQEESIKIEKNSRGVNWEYKLLGKVEEQIARIDNIESVLKSKLKEVN
jgi:hypothetical protein